MWPMFDVRAPILLGLLPIVLSGLDADEKVFQPMRVLVNPNSNPHMPLIPTHPLDVAVQPANYTGPAVFSSLVGHCFHLVAENYRYDVCPFQNVTQQDISSAWNAYRGVIGTWRNWLVRDERLHGMVMDNGDLCSPGKRRHAHVVLSCGEQHQVLSVRESVTCFYIVNFSTPTACHPDSRLVYPLLSSGLRRRWDRAVGFRTRNLLTAKGYDEEIRDIFAESGFIHTTAETVDNVKAQCAEQMDSCRQEVRSLRKQVWRLKGLLAKEKKSSRHHRT